MADAPRWVGRAFGLELLADFPILGLKPVDDEVPLCDTVLRRASAQAIHDGWPKHDRSRLLDRRGANGQAGMTVDMHPEAGYLIEAPGYGSYWISGDGTLLQCAPATGPEWMGLRPLFAQALPLAATLRGLELLHASAVVIDGAALAFTAAPGVGKTSLAVHLATAHGASLLADDVLALTAGRDIEAQPGVPFANVSREQLLSLSATARTELGQVIGESDKLHVAVNGLAPSAAPLRGLYFLERSPSVPALRFEQVAQPDPRLLLGAAFMAHVTTPVRLRAQLDTCALIADKAAVFQLAVPASVDAATLAARVAEHARAAHWT